MVVAAAVWRGRRTRRSNCCNGIIVCGGSVWWLYIHTVCSGVVTEDGEGCVLRLYLADCYYHHHHCYSFSSHRLLPCLPVLLPLIASGGGGGSGGGVLVVSSCCGLGNKSAMHCDFVSRAAIHCDFVLRSAIHCVVL